MPLPRHWRLVFGGPLYATEEWSCSLKIGDRTPGGLQPDHLVPGTPAYDTLNSQAAVDDAAADVRTFWTTAGLGINPAARLGYVKLNEIGPEGRYASQVITREVRYASPVLPATTTLTAPPQNALAVTLRSARQRGPLSRGRFFLPTVFGPNNSTDPLITTANATAVANAVRTLVINLGNWPGVDITDAGVVLVSPGGRGVPEGGIAPVTQVQVGRLVDTQQRRRVALDETPTTVAV